MDYKFEIGQAVMIPAVIRSISKNKHGKPVYQCDTDWEGYTEDQIELSQKAEMAAALKRTLEKIVF